MKADNLLLRSHTVLMSLENNYKPLTVHMLEMLLDNSRKLTRPLDLIDG